MLTQKTDRYIYRVRKELEKSFAEEHTPREVAGSFALGAFITMLPTLGTGLLVFVLLAYSFNWINKIALFASVLVFNPVVKWGVYAASFTLGVLLLGPVEGISMTQISFSAGPEVVVRLVVGNIILAVLATIPSYFIVYRLTIKYRNTLIGEKIDEAVEEIVDEIAPE